MIRRLLRPLTVLATVATLCASGCAYLHKGMTGKFPDDPPSGFTADEIAAMDDDRLVTVYSWGAGRWDPDYDPNVIAEVKKRGWFSDEEWAQIEREEVMIGQRQKVAYFAALPTLEDAGGLTTATYQDRWYRSRRHGTILCRGGEVIAVGR